MIALPRLFLVLTLAACAAPVDTPRLLTGAEITAATSGASIAAPTDVAARGAALRARADRLRRE